MYTSWENMITINSKYRVYCEDDQCSFQPIPLNVNAYKLAKYTHGTFLIYSLNYLYYFSKNACIKNSTCIQKTQEENIALKNFMESSFQSSKLNKEYYLKILKFVQIFKQNHKKDVLSTTFSNEIYKTITFNKEKFTEKLTTKTALYLKLIMFYMSETEIAASLYKNLYFAAVKITIHHPSVKGRNFLHYWYYNVIKNNENCIINNISDSNYPINVIFCHDLVVFNFSELMKEFIDYYHL